MAVTDGQISRTKCTFGGVVPGPSRPIWIWHPTNCSGTKVQAPGLRLQGSGGGLLVAPRSRSTSRRWGASGGSRRRRSSAVDAASDRRPARAKAIASANLAWCRSGSMVKARCSGAIASAGWPPSDSAMPRLAIRTGLPGSTRSPSRKVAAAASNRRPETSQAARPRCASADGRWAAIADRKRGAASRHRPFSSST